MSKNVDPFEKFKAATLGESSLVDAMKPSSQKNNAVISNENEVRLTPVQGKVSKMSNKEQVCFYLEKDLKKKLGLIKYENDISFSDLYEEAVTLLLQKYGKI